MTGFGRGVAEHGGLRATIDVRGVNHRFLDLKLRGAPVAPAVEEAVSAKVRGSLERGAVTVTIHVDRLAGASGARIDAAAARAAYDALVELARTLGTAGPDLALVLAQPGVTISGETGEDTAEAPVLPALEAALRQLLGMRDLEGQALATELTARFDELARLHDRIERVAQTVPELTKRRLNERLRKLIGDEVIDKSSDAAGWIDPARLAQEVALMADRADVSEELVRLTSHLAQARGLINGEPASGRRLDFLVQEIGRELNTIGSKSAVAEISAAIVEAKAVLEKVREQVQNVE